ncbi:TetR/AcrR family transcriptional regulator [Actinoplanes palleronii]|uniref:HTH tetR-type domain-containing protein n=1 Tax=Actinoplanes palleronii TaxID=113570 RepID=A0ABQ4BNZ2_9ACTN|nr:TetR/AcrR family transcriptional regulator [Actinoplanes palleronii]GIE72327.1 hypothetical protein Apa02nite_084350 [Actinoplanes palleronii]
MTRKLLLSAALQLFQSKGYASTTVDDIASTAGTTRVTFYAYFKSRSDLARALIGELNDLLGRSASAPVLVDVVAAGTYQAMAGWLHHRSSSWELFRPHLSAISEAATVEPELRGLVVGWFEEVIAEIKNGLDRAGRFVPEVRHSRAVLAFVQLDHLGRHWTEGRSEASREQVVTVLAESWFTLLGERP